MIQPKANRCRNSSDMETSTSSKTCRAENVLEVIGTSYKTKLTINMCFSKFWVFRLSSVIVIVILKCASLIQKFLPSKEKTYSNLVVRSTGFEYVFVYLDALNFYDFVLVVLVSTLNRFHVLIYCCCYQLWTWLLEWEVYSQPSRTSTLEPVTKIVKGLQLLINFAKSSISNVWLGSGTTLEYTK